MSASQTTDSAAAWRVLLGAGLVTAVGLGPVWGATLGLFLRPLQQELGWSRSGIGFGMTVQVLFGTAFVVFVGWISDRWRLRPLLLAGVVLQAINIAAFSLLGGSVWNFYLLALSIVIMGAGPSPIVLSKIVQGWFVRRLGFAFGVLFASAAVGAMIHPLVAQAMMGEWGWRGAYQGMAAISLVIGGLAAAFLVFENRAAPRAAPAPVIVPTRARPKWTESSLVQLVRTRQWLLLAVWNMLFGLGASGIGFHLAAMLQDRGISPAQSALALSAVAAGRLVGDLVAGWLVDRLPARRLAFVVMLLPLLPLALLISVVPMTLVVAMSAAFLLGLSSGADGCLSAFLAQRYFGAAVYGQAYATQLVAAAIGGGLAPWLTGLMYEAQGGYNGALAAAMVVFSCAALAALALPQLPGVTAKPATASA